MHFLLQANQPLYQPGEASCRAILQCLFQILVLEREFAFRVCAICTRSANSERKGSYGERFWIGFTRKQGDDTRGELQWQKGTDW